jgi:hypothetical protein
MNRRNSGTTLRKFAPGKNRISKDNIKIKSYRTDSENVKWILNFSSTRSGFLLLLSVGLPIANAPDVLQPCGLLYYP